MNQVGIDAATQTFQSGQSGCAIFARAGKGFEEGVIARKYRGGICDLLVALFDELLENLRAGAQPSVDFREGMFAIGVPNDKIGRALQESEKRDQRKKEPAAETAEMKPQG